MRIHVPSRLRPLVEEARAVGADFTRNRASLAAGGLAYFVTLSLAPLAIAFGGLAGIVLDPAQVSAALASLLAQAPEPLAASDLQLSDALMALVSGASAASTSITTAVGFLLALYAASKVVYGARLALDTAFGFEPTRAGFVARGAAAIFTLAALVVAVVLVVVVTVLPRILEALGVTTVRLTTGTGAGDWILVFALVFLAVRAVMAFGASERVRVPWLSPGVIIAAMGIVASTAFVGAYAHFSATMSAAVQVLGAPVVLLMWLYFGFLSLLLGATVIARGRATASPQPA